MKHISLVFISKIEKQLLLVGCVCSAPAEGSPALTVSSVSFGLKAVYHFTQNENQKSSTAQKRLLGRHLSLKETTTDAGRCISANMF